jgi:hypothetical protein
MIITTLKLKTLVTKRKSKTDSTPKAEPEINPESIYLICRVLYWQSTLCVGNVDCVAEFSEINAITIHSERKGA